ncbi:MAG: transporter substrate-binding domain-containing protein [Clostridia bacterium]|nr:transporter substrate-binding domain-containing protein [Clostridia bacterium]
MRKIFSLVLVLAMAFSAAASAETLRVGMECNYAPYNWTQAESSDTAVAIAAGGYADGYDVQMAKLIAEGLGMELEIVKTEWDGLVPSLLSGVIDVIIAGMSPTEERKVTIAFTEPYYESELVVVVRNDGPYADAKTLADLSGARITGQLNTFHYTVIDQIPGVSKMTAMDTFPTMIVALSSGAIDGYVSEKPGAISAMASNPDITYVEFDDGQGFACEPSDAAISVGLVQGSELLEPINAILAGISDDERQMMMDEAVANQPLSE